MDKLTIAIRDSELIKKLKKLKTDSGQGTMTKVIDMLILKSDKYEYQLIEVQRVINERNEAQDKYLNLMELLKRRNNIDNQINKIIK